MKGTDTPEGLYHERTKGVFDDEDYPDPTKLPWGGEEIMKDKDELEKAWKTYCGDKKMPLDSAFIFTAGFIAGQNNMTLNIEVSVKEMLERMKPELEKLVAEAYMEGSESGARIMLSEKLLKQEPVAVIGAGFQLLYCRQDWSKDLMLGDPLYKLPPIQGWQPIETAPKDGTELLLTSWSKENGFSRTDHGFWGFIENSDADGSGIHGWLSSYGDIEEPTHYQLAVDPK